MELKKESWKTVAEMEALPEGTRAELIDGVIYDMAAPTIAHQRISSFLTWKIRDYIYSGNGKCEVFAAPFDVQLDKDDYTLVQPDISVICDKTKLTDRGCSGAPDFIIEVVSPSSRKHDYSIKNTLYSQNGVREYWIVDPAKERTTIYRYVVNPYIIIIN